MTQRRALIIQTILEAAIPLLGYFYWNWDTSFILMFFFLDWLLYLSIVGVKANKRFQYSTDLQEKKQAFQDIISGLLLLIATSTLVYFLLPKLENAFSWKERIWAFLTYKDMGVQQGLILIPLIVLNGVLVYKQQFIAPRLYERLTMKQITLGVKRQGILLLGAAGCFLGFRFFTPYPSEIILFSTIAGTMLYRFFARN
jgi:hypothetical protein